MATTTEYSGPKLVFTRSWENPGDYPTLLTDEAQIRADMQSLHDETKSFLNDELGPYIDTADIDGGEW